MKCKEAKTWFQKLLATHCYHQKRRVENRVHGDGSETECFLGYYLKCCWCKKENNWWLK